MTIEQSPQRADPPNIVFENRERRTVASYKRELVRHRRAESWLREALAREEALLGQKDALIQQQAVLRQEADHRLLKGLQNGGNPLSVQGPGGADGAGGL